MIVEMGKKKKRRKKKRVSIASDSNMPFRHGRLLKSEECMKSTIYEQGFVLQNNYIEQNSFEAGGQLFPMKRSVSCASCLLCESNTRMREFDGVLGNGMKKVASCSMCVWDVDDNKWSEEEINQLSSDESQVINHFSSDELTQPSSDENDGSFPEFYQKRSNSYALGINEEDVKDLTFKFKNEDLYNAEYDELEIHERYSDDMSISRTSPDGGECDNFAHDFDENRVKFTSTPEMCGVRSNDTFCEISEDEIDNVKNEINLTIPVRKVIEKQNKKVKPTKHRKSLDKKATEELDEIFGKIQRKKSTVYESDKDGEQNFMFRPLSRSFSLSRPRKYTGQSKIKKYYSVEDLSPKGDYTPRLGVLSKSQSTLELSKLGSNTEDAIRNDELLKRIEDQRLYNRWLEYLQTIGGASSLAGNKSLRYIWQQIMLYHEDLQQPLEEFLKSNLEKSQQLYTSYQELEGMLELKSEQQEKETAKIYNDVEQAIQQEREQLQEIFAEKEELAKKETQKIVQAKEQEIETLVQLNSALNDKIKQLEVANEELKVNKEKIELQFSRLTGTHSQLRKENDSLNEVNNALVEKMKFYDLVLKEQEEHVCNVNKQCETAEEKFRETKQLNLGVTEENEFLKLNVSNLTAELEDVKAKNKLLHERRCSISSHGHYLCNSDDQTDNNYFENSFNDEPSSAVSPIVMNSTYNSTFNKPDNNSKPTTSLMEEVTPFLASASPINTIKTTSNNVNFNKSSLLNVHKKTPSTTRKNLSMLLSRNTAPSKIRLATNKPSDYKVIFTGDSNVGKTSLIRRICHGKFRSIREETCEPDFSTKELEYNDQKLKLKLWDTLGQERFNSIPPSYFRKSDIVILMYDIAEEVSFINAKTWIRTIHDYTNEDIFILLVASKADMHHKRRVSSKKGQELATNNDAMFIETSAKTGENISSLCEMIASTLVAREETVFIRKDFESSLCSLSYSMSQTNRVTNCCAT